MYLPASETIDKLCEAYPIKPNDVSGTSLTNASLGATVVSGLYWAFHPTLIPGIITGALAALTIGIRIASPKNRTWDLRKNVPDGFMYYVNGGFTRDIKLNEVIDYNRVIPIDAPEDFPVDKAEDLPEDSRNVVVLNGVPSSKFIYNDSMGGDDEGSKNTRVDFNINAFDMGIACMVNITLPSRKVAISELSGQHLYIVGNLLRPRYIMVKYIGKALENNGKLELVDCNV